MTKVPGQKDSKVIKGIRMLWPYITEDLAKAPDESLYTATQFVNLMTQLCITGPPPDMTFEDYLQAIFDGEIKLLPGVPVELHAQEADAG